MKKLIYVLIMAMIFMSGCKNNEPTPQEVIETTKENTIGTWKSEEGETYTFGQGYMFEGNIYVNGELKEVSGDYNLVTVDGDETTLTINTDSIRQTYIVKSFNESMTLTDLENKNVEKILKIVK